MILGKFGQFFKIKPKRFLGIDIGASFIRIVEISRKGQKYFLENYGQLELDPLNGKPYKTFEKNVLNLSSSKVAVNINNIIKEAEIKSREACISIPDFGSFFTNINLPAMDEEEISQAVKYQVRPYIPLSLEDVTLDWSITEGKPPKTPIKVLVVAIPNDIIDHYTKIADYTDLNIKFLEPEVFSLARALTRIEKKGVIGLIDMGAISTTCSVLDQGMVKLSFSFNVAGNELTEVIASALNISYNEAEKIKRSQGVLPDDQNQSNNIRKLLIPLIGSILDESKKAFRAFYSQEGKEVEKIILSGGLSFMPGLKELFAIEFNKQIIMADPFFGIEFPPAVKNILKEIGPYYGVAVGLALKGLE